MIGFDTLTALVLGVEVFSGFGGPGTQDLGFFWNHSMATASFAKAIAKVQLAAPGMVDDAFAAGLLHDVGRLVLASAFGQEYQNVLRLAAEPGALLAECEEEAFGCTHNVAGAYLLGIWGLADPVVEAVAWHHQPSRAEPKSFSALIAVHAADCFANQMHPDPGFEENSALDEPLLSRLGLHQQLAAWSQTCGEVITRSERNG